MGIDSLMSDRQNIKFLITKLSPFLDKRERVTIYKLIGINIAINVIDLVSALLLSILGILTIGLNPDELIENKYLRILLAYKDQIELNGMNFTIFIAVVTFVLIITKILLSTFFSRYSMLKLADISVSLSNKCVTDLFDADYRWIRKQEVQEISYAVNQSSQYLVIGVIGQLIIILSEMTLLLFLFICSALTNFNLTLLILTIIMLIVYLYSSKLVEAIRNTSEENVEAIIRGQELTIDSLKMWREINISKRKNFIIQHFKIIRTSASHSFAINNWLQSFPKIVFEIAGMLIAFLALSPIVGFTFANSSEEQALVIIGLMLRALPVGARVQQNFLSIHSYLAPSRKFLDLISEVKDNLSAENDVFNLNSQSGQRTEVLFRIRNLEFRHKKDDNSLFFLKELEIPVGSVVSIIGPSGCGKTSFVEVLLGLLKPTLGEVFFKGAISIQLPFLQDFITNYVSQNTKLIQGSIRENILFGLPKDEYSDEKIWELLADLELDNAIMLLPNNLDTVINSDNPILSGGEQQRLGLARALINRPNLLVIDEALNALDSSMASRIAKLIASRKYATTVISITHGNDFQDFSELILTFSDGVVTTFLQQIE